MPYKRTKEVQEARDCQLDQAQTDSEKELTKHKSKREHRGGNQKSQKDFALDLPLLVDETARDVKILDAIAAIEKQQLDDIFYPYRPHQLHLSTRFGLLFYNDRIVIPENMRTTVIAMLHH